MKSDQERFIVTFSKLEGPTSASVEHVIGRIVNHEAGAKVEEVVPGTLLVEGHEDALRRAVSDLPDWSFAREGRLRSVPSARARIRATR